VVVVVVVVVVVNSDVLTHWQLVPFRANSGRPDESLQALPLLNALLLTSMLPLIALALLIVKCSKHCRPHQMRFNSAV
jgi:hypothetical protein